MRNEHSAAEKIKEISGTNPLKCMKCGKCKFKINIGNTEETGDAFCTRVSSYFPINCKDNCHFLPEIEEI